MDVYKKNIHVLSKTHPHLVQLIEDTVVDEDKIHVSRTRTDGIEVCYRRDDGKTVIIGDETDLTQLPARAKELVENNDWTKIFLLLGFGLGSYPEKLLKLIGEKGTLIVYEAIPELFKAVLGKLDLTEIFRSNRFNLILGETPNDFKFISKYHRQIVGKKFYILKQNTFVALRESAYEDFRSKVINEKRLVDTRVATGVLRAAEWADALMANIPTIIRTPGVNCLKGILAGRPAIVVSAGPSLEKNLHLLKEVKGRATIIAVDVVVPTLLPAGIIPDFVVTLEANPTQYKAFQNNPLLRFTPLVCTGEVHHETLTAVYPGPLFLTLFPNSPIYTWLHRFWEDKGFIEQFGGSVSHVAFALAQFMGADPIALVAQDLSFREKLHAGDVTELFYPEEYIERNKRRNPIVKDIFGEDRYTLGQFLSFRTSFEKKISKSKGTFINATEGGIPIEGMKIMRLKDYIEEYCNVPFLDIQALLESFETKKPAYDLEGLITGILRDKSKLRIVRKNASKIIECVTRLKELKEKRLHNTDEESRLIQRISRLEVRVKNPVVKIVDPYRSRMENYIWRDKCDEVALDLIQDSLDYYSELNKVIDSFILKVEELLVILKRESEVDQIMADENNSLIDKYFRVGVIHRDIGLVRQSVTEFERVANEFSRLSDSDSQLKYWPTAISAFSALAELYAKQQRFSEARKILDTLSEFVSNKNSNTQSLDQGTILKLMETCKEGMAAWEEKKQLMVSLLREAEDNYGSYLESGSFYYRTGDHDRSVREYLKSVEDTRALLLKRNISNSTDANIIIRLLSTYYGLAQTYMAMGKQKEAISALDSGCKEIEQLDRFDLPGILEEFSTLIVDLYVCLNAREKALSFGQQMLTIFPNGTKMKVKLQTIMAQGSSRLMAAQG